MAKIVDDRNAAGEGDAAKQFIDAFIKRFKLGTIGCGPGKLRVFGINIEQEEDMVVSTDVGNKRNALTEHLLSRQRQKQHEKANNKIEGPSFSYTNSSFGLIGLLHLLSAQSMPLNFSTMPKTNYLIW